MKKIIALCIVAILAISTVSAKKYKVAVGLATGFEYGPSLKVNFTDNLTLINDLAFVIMPNTVFGANGGTFNFGYMGLVDNANFAYEKKITSGKNIDFSFFGGGGMSLGYADMGEAPGGKFGINAIGGIEADMTNAPIEFTFDFRPGYAMLFADGGAIHGLDWSIVLAVRYTF